MNNSIRSHGPDQSLVRHVMMTGSPLPPPPFPRILLGPGPPP